MHWETGEEQRPGGQCKAAVTYLCLIEGDRRDAGEQVLREQRKVTAEVGQGRRVQQNKVGVTDARGGYRGTWKFRSRKTKSLILK